MADRLARALGGFQADQQVDLEALLGGAMDEIVRLVEADRGTLYLVDHARGELVSRVAHLPELSEIRLRIGEGVAGAVASSGEVAHVQAGEEDPRLARRIDEATGYRTESMLAVPACDEEGVVIAVLQVLNKRAGEFGAEDAALLTELAAELRTMLLTARRRRELASRRQLCAVLVCVGRL